MSKQNGGRDANMRILHVKRKWRVMDKIRKVREACQKGKVQLA